MADVLLFERVGDGVDFVAATAWVTPRPPTRALAAIETAIAVCLRFIVTVLSHLPPVAMSTTSWNRGSLVIV